MLLTRWFAALLKGAARSLRALTALHNPERFRFRPELEPLEQRLVLDDGSAGPFGIAARNLQWGGVPVLDGTGVRIGQVGRTRVARAGLDAEGLLTAGLTPAQVYFGDAVAQAGQGLQDPDAREHDRNVASVMILDAEAHRGVAHRAQLHSAAFNTALNQTNDVKYLVAVQRLAQENLRVVNLSDYVTTQALDGTSLLTQGIDWSAAQHNILYVVARGNKQRGANNAALATADAPRSAPKDNYNGIKVTASQPVQVGNNWVYNKVADISDFTNATAGDNQTRYLTDIVAPGADIFVPGAFQPVLEPGGASLAAPHVTATVALLQQFANTRNWGAPAQRHEVMKAVLMNSADKLAGVLGSTRTITKRRSTDTWLESPAADNNNNPNGRSLPLDEQLGAGHLNAQRALWQFSAGQHAPNNPNTPVPKLGWDYNTSAGQNDVKAYRFAEPLRANSYISLTLTWDRLITKSTAGTTYNPGDTFAAGNFADLNLELVRRRPNLPDQVVWTSNSQIYNVEHIFFQLTEGGDYEFRVRQTTNFANINYAVAWWGVTADAANARKLDGSTWLDVDADGIRGATEQPLANAQVTLFDSNGLWMDSQLTDANGHYSFAVAPGTYRLLVTAPPGYEVTLQNQGADATLDSDIDSFGFISDITIVDDDETRDAGFVPPGQISGKIWRDHNTDGILNPLEGGLPNIWVGLYLNGTELVDVVQSGSDGVYNFLAVSPGTYQIRVLMPDEYVATVSPLGTDETLDSDINSAGWSDILVVAPAAAIDNIDAGLIGNRAPELEPVPDQVVDPGQMLTWQLEAWDPDGPMDSLIFSLAPGAPVGAAVDAVTGLFTFSSGQGPESYTVTVLVTDGLASASRSFLVRVTDPNNLPPSVYPDAYTVPHDRALTVSVAEGVLSWEFDPEGESLIAELVEDSGPQYGTLIFDADGSFVYQPYYGFVGLDGFYYRSFDGERYSEPVYVTITVANETPYLSPLADEQVDEGQTRIDYPTAYDMDNDSLTFSLGAGVPTWASIDPLTGELTLTPDDGPATITVTVAVSDGVATASTSFQVTVNNVAPTATFLADASGLESIPVNFWFDEQSDPSSADTSAGFLYSFDFNADGDFTDDGEALEVSSNTLAFVFSQPGWCNIHGRISDTDGGYNDYWTSVEVVDVNDAPASADHTVTTNEDTPYQFTLSDFGFTDPNDFPWNNFQAVKFTTLPSAGSLTVDSMPVTVGDFISVSAIQAGLLVFTPAANANGFAYASFTFQVQDDGGIANGGSDLDPTPNTITIDVTAVNDAPVNTAPSDQTTLEGTDLVFSTANGNAISVADVDAGTAELEVNLLAMSGTLTLAGTADLTFTSGDGTADTSMTFTGTIAAINAALAGLAYTPMSNYTSGYVYINTSDLGNTGTSGPQSDFDTFNTNVTPVNDPPSGMDNTVTIWEDGTHTFSASAFGFSDPGDSPNDNFQGVKITTLPATGTLTNNGTAVSAGAVISVSDIQAGKLVFTPAANGFGSPYASFTFQLQDDGGTANGGSDLDPTPNTMTIDVTGGNDAPVNTVPGAQTTDTNTDLVFSTANGNAISIADVDAGSALLQLSLTAMYGQLTLSSTTGLTFSDGDGTDDYSMTFTGTLADINAALEGLIFAPEPSFSFGYLYLSTSDLGNTGSGGILTDYDTVDITINL